MQCSWGILTLFGLLGALRLRGIALGDPHCGRFVGVKLLSVALLGVFHFSSFRIINFYFSRRWSIFDDWNPG